VADPQEPDPKVFWCPKCRAHTDYSETKVWVEGDRGPGRYKVILKCKTCDSKGGVPSEKIEWVRNVCKIVMLGTITVFIICLSSFIMNERAGQDSGSLITMILILASISTLFLAIITGGSFYFYKRWVKWAKERGWEGE
jgi:hypothetical protein